MFLTRKQRSVLRLRASGLGPTEIARMTGMNRVTISKLWGRTKRNLRQNGIDPEKLLAGKELDLMELVG